MRHTPLKHTLLLADLPRIEEHVDWAGAERLRRRSRQMQERSIDLREWSIDLPEPARIAMRRRASELDLNAAALALAADGLQASNHSALAATGSA